MTQNRCMIALILCTLGLACAPEGAAPPAAPSSSSPLAESAPAPTSGLITPSAQPAQPMSAGASAPPASSVPPAAAAADADVPAAAQPSAAGASGSQAMMAPPAAPSVPPGPETMPPGAPAASAAGALRSPGAAGFCDKYEMHCGFGMPQRHADRAACMQDFDADPLQQACKNMHLDTAIAGTAAACNGMASDFCFSIHCLHASGLPDPTGMTYCKSP